MSEVFGQAATVESGIYESHGAQEEGVQPGLIVEEVKEMRERIGWIESFIKQAAALAAVEARRAHEIQRHFQETMETLQGQLREKDEVVFQREAILNKLEESLRKQEESVAARVDDLEAQVRERDRLLAIREAEMSSKCQEAEAAAAEVRKLQELRHIYEDQIHRKDELLRRKDLALRGLQENLTAKIRELVREIEA